MSEDFNWFKEHYSEFQDKYGKSFIAIKNKAKCCPTKNNHYNKT